MFAKVHVFFEDKGYGFIRENFRLLRFFHIHDYQGEALPTPGMVVEYDLAPGRPGKPDKAIHVIPAEAHQ